jgi:type I restriction-modification system DNA methylase subunit
MTNISQLEPAMKAANDAWGFNPLQKVRMPMLENQLVITEEVDVLWTDGGLRPNANNLAFLMQSISGEGEVEQWTKRLTTFPVRGSLLISPSSFYFLQSNSDIPNELETHQLNLDTWREMLVSPKSHLFKPRELAKLKSGQLSLADLEDTNLEGSFSFLLREQQKKIEQAFLQGIKEALEFVDNSRDSVSSRSEIKGHVIRFAIAYLAARILEDKNFFNAKIEDPIELLERIGKIRNGFFKKAIKSADHAPFQSRKAIARHMGYQVSFVLADHRDVGRLYEQAIKSLKEQHKDLDDENWGDLKQHYTPVAIAERMLEALPLERLRPSERIIFDPAAGSGSLLLAATSRLAGMTDITPEERNSYLRTNVIGNDLDPYASWIAQLRYFLASESLGSANEPCQISEVLPFPDSFTQFNYNDLELDTLSVKPRVIIANPPFEERGNVQEAAKFVKKAISLMEENSQFAFVLPQSFLTSTTHGIENARNLISKNCQILEIWQFPEGVIGTNARQSTCVIIGIVNKNCETSTISRAVFSGARIDEIREKGFLGKSWIINLNLLAFSKVTAPSIHIPDTTLNLGNLFYTFSGVNPGSLGKIYKPIPKPIAGIKCKRYWRLTWKGKNRLWADPSNIPSNQQWIRYSPDFLEGLRLDKESLFDLPKILVGRKVNRNSSEPLVARLDTIGFCPNNDVYCVFPVEEIQRYNSGYEDGVKPENLSDFTVEEQKLWLLGLLSSGLLNAMSLIGRNSREMVKKIFLDLPIPRKIDSRIISVTLEIIQREQDSSALQKSNDLQIKELRHRLNNLVEESYGKPIWSTPQRIGKSPELESWNLEQEIKKTKTAIGQVLEISEDKRQVLMYISRLMDDDNTEGEWIPLPQELPAWALDGTPFEVELSHDVKTFEQLRERPWALRRFRHEPRTYLTDDELEEFLRMPELEVLS